MIKNTITIGDKIITTKTAECGENKKGMIICIHRDNNSIYGIKFNFEDAKFHKLQYDKKHKGILNKNQGLWLETKDFQIIPTTHKLQRRFNNFLLKNYLKTLEIIPTEIKRSKSIIESQRRNIKERLEYNQKNLDDIKKHQESIKKLEQANAPEIENYFQWYKKLQKHPDIKNILIEDNFLIIQTNDLIYHHFDDTIEDFNLGAYYIFIPNNFANEIRATNYKKQHKQGECFHPCIRRGTLCLGDDIRKETYKYFKENQILFLIYLLINFLKEPNYSSPYLKADRFRCAQPVTYHPIKVTDYLSDNNWYQHEKWSEKKYYKDLIHFYKLDINRFNENNIHLDYIETLNSKIEDCENSLENL